MLPNALRPRHCLRLSHYLLVIHPHAPPHHWVPLTTSLYKPFPVPSNSDGQGPVFSCRGSFWKVGAILQISQLMLVLTALLSVTFQHHKRKEMTYFCLYFFFDPQCVLNFPKVSVVEPSKVKKVDHRQTILFKNWMFFFLSLSIFLSMWGRAHTLPQHAWEGQQTHGSYCSLVSWSPSNGTQAIGTGGKHLYPLTHLTSPYISCSRNLAFLLHLWCLKDVSSCDSLNDFAYWSSERLSVWLTHHGSHG